MALWHCLAVWMALAAACTQPATRHEQEVLATDQPAFALSGELVYDAGQLSVVHPDGHTAELFRPGARPYRVVCDGPPTLVTAVSAELDVVTWALGGTVREYLGMYPLLCVPPLVALGALPTSEYSAVGGCTLLGADGDPLWSSPQAALLWPAGGPVDYDTAYVAVARAMGQPGWELLFPFGSSPQLASVDTASGAVNWSADLVAASAVADVQLWGLTSTDGLISVQYDYRRFEFIAFERDSGRLTGRWELRGQPATRIVYPGGFDEATRVTVEGGLIAVDVFAENRAELWEFDLASGQLNTAARPVAGRAVREENPLPPGGAGPPQPASPPFPLQLLPGQSGASWRIPALRNQLGEVLIVDSTGARWIDLEQDTGD